MSEDIGYGKPPKGRQYKKGQSGNRKGRPRKPRTPDEVLPKVLSQKTTVTVRGHRKRVSLLEAYAMQAAQAAATGDFAPMMKLQKVIEGLTTPWPPLPDQPPKEPTAGMRVVEAVQLLLLLEDAGVLTADEDDRMVLTADTFARILPPDLDSVAQERAWKAFDCVTKLRGCSERVDEASREWWRKTKQELRSWAGG